MKRSLAIVTCMDARLDDTPIFECWGWPTHVVRNAGGRVTDDVLRSLAVSCANGTKRVLVVHHTRCAMAERDAAVLRSLLPPGADPRIDLLTIGDHPRALLEDVQKIRSSNLIPADVEVLGYLHDLDTGATDELAVDRATSFPSG